MLWVPQPNQARTSRDRGSASSQSAICSQPLKAGHRHLFSPTRRQRSLARPLVQPTVQMSCPASQARCAPWSSGTRTTNAGNDLRPGAEAPGGKQGSNGPGEANEGCHYRRRDLLSTAFYRLALEPLLVIAFRGSGRPLQTPPPETRQHGGPPDLFEDQGAERQDVSGLSLCTPLGHGLSLVTEPRGGESTDPFPTPMPLIFHPRPCLPQPLAQSTPSPLPSLRCRRNGQTVSMWR